MEGVDRTYKMADSHFFQTLSKPVHLINTSRGSVIDEDALLSAMSKKIVRSCILDVWESEPYINTELLLKVDLATPHIAGYSTDGKANGTTMSVQAVSRFFGLGKDDWKPGNLPEPEKNPLIIDCLGLSEMEVLRDIYNQTYSISLDDRMLRDNVPDFELLRGSYRIRREPCAFNVQLKNNKFEALPGKLEKLGFSIMNQQ
jgi:erythronate-4-phosphate dehydrogenase